MFESDQYQLLDFGNSRKLERFGEIVLDRPSPPAVNTVPRLPLDWTPDVNRFERTTDRSGTWTPRFESSFSWRIHHAQIVFELRPTPAGQLGVFPEQAENWDWIQKQVRRHKQPLRVLNLFAYTGGSSLAAAAAGAQVTHVDAAKNIVSWAKTNAQLSNLSDKPIRWIVEDSLTFVQREVRRGNHYDAVILDPPSYGHGPKGEPWKLSKDLMTLLRACSSLIQGPPVFLLLTCHSPGFGPAELSACVDDAFFGHCQSGTIAKRLSIHAKSGGRLDAGCMARWPT